MRRPPLGQAARTHSAAALKASATQANRADRNQKGSAWGATPRPTRKPVDPISTNAPGAISARGVVVACGPVEGGGWAAGEGRECGLQRARMPSTAAAKIIPVATTMLLLKGRPLTSTSKVVEASGVM